MKTRHLLPILLLSLSTSAHALDLGFAKDDAGHAGVLLDYAASARSLGMGRAFTGIADDASAGYWNAAGLTQLTRKDVVTLYSDLGQDINFGFASYAQPTVGYGTFGLSVVNLRSGNIERRDSLGQQTGNFDHTENAALLSYGYLFQGRYAAGTTLKLVHQEIDSFSGNGYGADVGFMMDLRSELRMGLNIKNLVAPSITLDKEADTYARDIRAGFKYQPGLRWLVAADLNKTEDRSLKVSLGTEFLLSHLVTLRAGINETEVAAGFGIKMGDWDLDYAFAYQDAASGVDDLGGSHKFGFHVRFGNDVTNQALSLEWQKKGQLVLNDLKALMDQRPEDRDQQRVAEVVALAEKVIRHRGFVDPFDLYTAQGYIYYFKKNYRRSAQSLSEAKALVEPDIVTVVDVVEKFEVVQDLPVHGPVPLKNEDAVFGPQEPVVNENDFIGPMPVKEPVYQERLVRQRLVQPNPIFVRVHSHFEMAKAQMTKAETNQMLASTVKELKAQFKKNDYKAAVVSAKKILSLDPRHIEAAMYLEDSQRRIQEPINRELKIAQTNVERKEYLAAIRHLNAVMELDPNNKDAQALMNTAIQSLEDISKQQTAAAEEKKTSKRVVYEVPRDSDKSHQLYSQGLMLYSQGRLKEAVTAWKQAVDFDNQNTLARNAFHRAQSELKNAK